MSMGCRRGWLSEFLAGRRRQGYASRMSPSKLRPLLGYLDHVGVLPGAPPVMSTEVDRLVAEFCDYLGYERGLVAGSVTLYARVARRFLEESVTAGGRCPGGPVWRGGERRSCCASRSGSGRGRRDGRVRAAGVAAVLARPGLDRGAVGDGGAVGAATTEGLPRALPAGQLSVLLDSCDRATPVGCRDHAILMLLARLGLRCGEVAGLTLDDLDWRAGELVVRGKRSRTDRLPLPGDVGEALSDYLSRVPPPGFGRTVFLRSQAPIGPLSGDGVSEVVVASGQRAGIGPTGRTGFVTRRHRDAAAWRGSGEIGQVLRHQSLEVTAVYAKVDRSALSQLALPWPGSQS